MKKTFVALAAIFLASAQLFAQPVITKADKDRAAELVSKMTLEEKCLLIAGQVDGFHTAAIERLGIPSVRMADGPQGVRNKTKSTYYPCGISLAATFNREAALGVGTGIGYDARARGVGIMLCPGVNIYRTALCGRNFEYYGEDPYLASETAVQYITGIQKQGVMSTIKHFALNNEEYDRHRVSSSADERTINEIYFPTFRKAVEKAHVAAVMTSYNLVNGVHAAEDPWLIKQNLRKWGHEGIVMSDWTSTYTLMGCVKNGLDLEMPKARVFRYADIKALMDNGVIEKRDIDEMCKHILQSFIAYGFLDKPMQDTSIPEDYEVSRQLAYNASVEGPVLLKNEGILPIKASKKNNIIILGPNANRVPYGGGSGRMQPIDGRAISLFQGMSNLGKGWNVNMMDWKNVNVDSLRKASAVIFAAGFSSKSEGENFDRKYTLPSNQDSAIAAVAVLNPNIIVVANSGGEFDINPWKDSVKAIILAWYSGQEGGTALADIISGKVSPSGRLPFTFWGKLENNPAYAAYHSLTPDISKKSKSLDPYPYVQYSEGIFLGYRGVEHFGVTPMYPFGYGLTYTSFAYSDLKVSPAGEGFDVTFTITNTGKVEASEVAQVYVAPVNPKVIRPAHELKGYEKVKIAAGKKGNSAQVTVHLDRDAFARYCSKSHKWVVDAGEYKIQVGSSASDILLEETVTVAAR